VHSLAAAQGFPTSVLWQLVLNPLFEGMVLRHIESHSEIASTLRATLHNTVSPTMLHAGSRTNVIPSVASAQVDGRLVPGQQPQDLLCEIRRYIGDAIEVEFLASSQPCESDPASPLLDLLEQVIAEHDPGSRAVPFIVPGATDARFLAAKGVKVYGFSPARQEAGWKALEMAHVPNERISLANVEFGTQVLYDVVRRFCT
jgi:acetylornithine deacetylase/succinyl-diaminopimelate desuccinylase-like protein